MTWWYRRAVLLQKRVQAELIKQAREKGVTPDPDDQWLQPKESEAVKEIQHAFDKAEESAEKLMPYLRPKLSVVKIQGGIKVTLQDLDEASDAEFAMVGRLIERASRRALTHNGGVGAGEAAAGIAESVGIDAGAKPEGV